MFDLHVHTAPDVQPRLGDDVEIVRMYERAGFDGCVLKGHYDGTAGRAQAAGHHSSVRVYGGLALNHHVGGLNPSAVAAALAMGARVIWMPTADAHSQETEGLPRLCRTEPRAATTTYAIPPIDPRTEDSVRQIVALIAEADAVLATGHLSTPEIAWLLPLARAAGVNRLLLTHPSWHIPAMDAAQASALADQGAYVEITAYQLLHQDRCDAGTLAQFARTVGLDRIILSSDAGQPDSPPPPEALSALVDALISEHLDSGAILACASELPDRLITPG
ncbi:MAG TPA: DUF6282 family protein [Solirubrobacteraceae bacterium]|nr:DUF6282 family protein [Solirubrobacteraceae bacterium]